LSFPCSGSGPQEIVSAGDFNHDGYNDIAMRHEYCNNSWYGIFTVHLGGTWLNPEPAFVIEGWTEPFNLIHFQAVAALGDINGDGMDDLAIGANGGIEQAAWRGKTVVLRGDADLIADSPAPPTIVPQQLDVSVYPNPFNSHCSVSLDLPTFYDRADLKIYNILGQQVRQIALSHVSGHADYSFSGGDLSTGIYFLHVSSGDLHSITKLMLLR